MRVDRGIRIVHVNFGRGRLHASEAGLGDVQRAPGMTSRSLDVDQLAIVILRIQLADAQSAVADQVAFLVLRE